MTCTAIVPYRPDDGHDRSGNLAVVLRWLDAMPVDCVLAVHGPAVPDELALGGRTTVVHVESTGPFSKAAACNAGVSATTTEVLALVDADTLVSRATFLGCVTRALGGVDAIRPFDQLVGLDPDATQRVRGGTDPASLDPDAATDRPGEVIPLCGGIVVVRTEAFERAGGMDETFVGWGGEDDALSTALMRTGSDCRILRDTRAYHLWHDREPAQRYRHPHYERNAARAQWWRTATDAQIELAAAEGRRRLRSGQP